MPRRRKTEKTRMEILRSEKEIIEERMMQAGTGRMSNDVMSQLKRSMDRVDIEMAEEMEVRRFKETQPPDGVVLEIGSMPASGDEEEVLSSIRGYRSPTAGRPIR